MPNPRKEGTFFNMKMSQDLYDRLAEYCEVTGIPKTTVVEKALRGYLDKAEEDSHILEKYSNK